MAVALHVHVSAYVQSLVAQNLTPTRNTLAEGTFPGNPLQLTKAQHIVGRKHIEMFADNYKVAALLLRRRTPRIEFHSARNHQFCAERVWSQDAERWMSDIENRFYQAVEDALRVGTIADQEAVTEYHSLCCARSLVSSTPPAPVDLRGHARQDYPDASRDALEFMGKGYYSSRGDETRAIAAAAVSTLMDIIQARSVFPNNIKWGIIDLPAKSAVLPDFFGTLDVPVRPDVVFHGFTQCDTLPLRQAVNEDLEAYIDRMTAKASKFIAARSKADLQRLLARYRGPGTA